MGYLDNTGLAYFWNKIKAYVTAHLLSSEIMHNDETVSDILGGEITASGSVASFEDVTGGHPASSLEVNIDPVQDLNGYDHPWFAGGGKNLLPNTLDYIKTLNTAGTWSGNVYTRSGVTFTVNDDGSVSTSGASTAENWGFLYVLRATSALGAILTDGEIYRISGCPSGGSASTYALQAQVNGSYNTDSGSGKQFTYTSGGNDMVRIVIGASGVDMSGKTFYPMICRSDATDPTIYAPYSNICPITGWTGATVCVSPTTDAEDGTTYTVNWQSEAGTVYGGTLDVVTGELVVDRVMIGASELISFYSSFTSEKHQYSSYLRNDYLSVSGASISQKNSCGAISNIFPFDKSWNDMQAFDGNTVTAGLYRNASWNYTRVYIVLPSNITTREDAETWLANSGIQIAYYLATPITYQLTPQEVATLLGQNNIWADTGDVSVTVKVGLLGGVTSVNGKTGAVIIDPGQGPKGDTGPSGVYYGSTTPDETEYQVWIDPNGTADGIPEAATALPAALGTAAVGVSSKYAREDHVHAKPSYTASEVGALPDDTVIPTKTSDLTNDSGFITGYTETDPTVPEWAKAESKPSYTASEVGAIAAPSSPTSGQFLVYDGSAWAAMSLSAWQGGNY